ncbi:MAG: histidine phosphatase family protein [Dehalococcoidia bacterium]|nr:MAG: histidine phosphatase family protein [Dehalococcoidia bacterium]
MTRIILVRHGQTEWNREERFRGRVDIDLDETGVRQAQAAAEKIARWDVAAIYSSPLKRAMATAQIIASRLGLPVEPLHGINDMDFGIWQGLSIEEARRRYRELFDLWRYSPQRLEIPEGETLEDVQRRAVATIDDLVARHQNETVALVTHRVVCKVLLCHLLGLDNSHFWQIAQDTTAINLFELWEGWSSLRLLNDTCHLRNLEA